PTGLAIENKMLTWTAVSDAAGYAVEIDGASHSASGASYSLSPLTAAKTYAIRVRAIGDGVNFRNSDWSAPVSYTVESSNPPSGNIDSMSCRQIVDYVFANVTQTQYIANRTPQEDWGWYSSTEQVRGTQVWFLGVNNVPFSEACAAESPMEPSDFSLVVIRLEASANAAQWRDSIYNGLSPMKWICAGADSKRVERIGSVIMAVIANAPDVDNLANAFFALGMAGESQPSGNIASMSCRQIVEHIYTNVPQTEYMQFRTPEEDWGWFLNTEQVRERCGWFLGVADIPFSEAFASEDGMGAAGFSLVVIKLESGANAVQWRDSIYNGLSPMKWVCMGGNAKRVERIGNVIMAVIANTPDIDSIVSAFNTLA
ncbi:MAG: hypothetical protein FWD58_07265, partial [Firmicutes bacterium]|nr:hypothetical protein [Bacillota bacterium]